MVKKQSDRISMLSWYCCNCGTRITAIEDHEGYYKSRCPVCRCFSVRISKGRRRDEIEIFAPKEMAHL